MLQNLTQNKNQYAKTYGIDKLNFYSPNFCLDLSLLAKERGIDPEKFKIGLGQNKMAVLPPDEDIVTMAADAALPILDAEDKEKIGTVLLASESGIDFSKAAGIYVHKLLDLPANCRVVELKQACYAATAGLHMALALLRQNPQQKILLLASDVARYGLNSAAESSQGAGAVAMLLSANPRTLVVEEGSGYYAEDLMDFWRPSYSDVPFVDGKYSCAVYLRFLEAAWENYLAVSERDFAVHDFFCYHVPVPKVVLKAHKKMLKLQGRTASDVEVAEKMQHALNYSALLGNCYTAALYLSVISLLENSTENLAGKRIGCYSYGSGAVAEFFSMQVVDGYGKHLATKLHQELLASRQQLTYQQYLDFYNFSFPQDGRDFVVPKIYSSGKFRLSGIKRHKRDYVMNSDVIIN